jgi:WASH complex subunit 7
MDLFRTLVTEIGNALGYVRMVRHGGLRYCSDAVKFVPDLAKVQPDATGAGFLEATKADNLSEHAQEAAANLDGILGNLTKNFAEGSDYFSLLVNVFGVRTPLNAFLIVCL